MPFIKLTLSKDELETLQEIAKEKNKSVQDYIRSVLFNNQSIFTPEEAERRALKLPKSDEPFSLPELYTPEEWELLSTSETGVFGRKWNRYVKNLEHIECVGKVDGRKKYIVKQSRTVQAEESIVE